MSAYSFEPIRTGGSGSGSGISVAPPAPLPAPGLIYAESTTATDGVTTLFEFTRPIRELVLATIGGSPETRGTTASGKLDLSAVPDPIGDPANVGLIKVGAWYLP